MDSIPTAPTREAVGCLVAAELIALAGPPACDPGVIIGYRPERNVADMSLTIGKNARLRTGAIIYGGTRIGDDFETGHNVIIREENTLGNDVTVWANSVIDYGCTVGDHVSIHCNCYIPQFTVIEDDVFIAPGCTFANDRYPGCPQSKAEMRGPILRRGCRIGVNVTTVPEVEIGEGALIGTGSVVTRDIPPHSVAVGNPAQVIKATRDLICGGARAYPDAP